MGNLQKIKKRKITLNPNTSKLLLTQSRKFISGAYTAFQFLPEANNHLPIQVKDPSLLRQALETKQVLDYALEIVSELLPQQNKANVTIYPPFSILKIHNESNSSDFLTNQIQFINDYVEKEAPLKKSSLPALNNNNDKQLDEIEHHVSSIKTRDEEQYNNEGLIKSNENSDVISEIKKSTFRAKPNSIENDRKGIVNKNNAQANIQKVNSNQMTLKPDDQVTVTSLLKQMNQKKSKDLLQKYNTIEEQLNQISPSRLNRINPQEVNHSIKSDRDLIVSINAEGGNTAQAKTMTMISPQFKNSNTIEVNMKSILANDQKQQPRQYQPQYIPDYKIITHKTQVPTVNQSTASQKQVREINDIDYKICITEPTKSNKISPSRIKPHMNNNKNGKVVNQSHYCKKYFKLKYEIEEEEILRKYFSNNHQSKVGRKVKDNYQIQIDLRKIAKINEEDNDDEAEYVLKPNNKKSPTLNKLITFSPTEDPNCNQYNINIPIQTKKSPLQKGNALEMEKTPSSSVIPRANIPHTVMAPSSKFLQLK